MGMQEKRTDEHRLQRLENWIFGENGKEGADERIRRMEITIGEVKDSISELTKAEATRSREEKGQKRERRGFYIGVLVMLVLLGTGGVRFATFMSERMDDILRIVGGVVPPL